MKQFYVLLAFALAYSNLCSAQYSSDNSTAANSLFKGEVSTSRSPQWEKEQDQINGRINKVQLSKMRSVTDALITFFHDSCISEAPVGPVWHGEYYAEKTNATSQVSYGVFCNFYEQKARLMILANDMSMLLDHLVVNYRDMLTIRIAAGTKNNCPYFEYDNNKIWLVTSGNSQSPYIPVTRKEYLREATQELAALKNNIALDWRQKTQIRSVAVQEAEKKAALEQLNAQYSGMDLQVRTRMFLRDYKTDEEYLKENTDKATADLDSTLHIMESLLKYMGPMELDKPAIVSVAAANFQGFEDGRTDKILIRMNPTYFNPTIGGEKPQLFLICWNNDGADPAAADIDRQLHEHLDGQKLREMLGK